MSIKKGIQDSTVDRGVLCSRNVRRRARAWRSSIISSEGTNDDLSFHLFSCSDCESLGTKAVRPLAKWWHRTERGQPHGNPCVNSQTGEKAALTNTQDTTHTLYTHITRANTRVRGGGGVCCYVTFLCATCKSSTLHCPAAVKHTRTADWMYLLMYCVTQHTAVFVLYWSIYRTSKTQLLLCIVLMLHIRQNYLFHLNFNEGINALTSGYGFLF